MEIKSLLTKLSNEPRAVATDSIIQGPYDEDVEANLPMKSREECLLFEERLMAADFNERFVSYMSLRIISEFTEFKYF